MALAEEKRGRMQKKFASKNNVIVTMSIVVLLIKNGIPDEINICFVVVLREREIEREIREKGDGVYSTTARASLRGGKQKGNLT